MIKGTDTAVRITYTGGSMDFTVDEVLYIKYSRTYKKDIFFNQQNYVKIYKLGPKRGKLLLTIGNTGYSTQTKIRALFALVDAYNQPLELLAYYRYMYDGLAQSLTCKLLRNAQIGTYAKGVLSANALDLNFVEVAT